MDPTAWNAALRRPRPRVVGRAEPLPAPGGRPTLTPGRALDVACGEGRNAIWLARRGMGRRRHRLRRSRPSSRRGGWPPTPVSTVDWVVGDVTATRAVWRVRPGDRLLPAAAAARRGRRRSTAPRRGHRARRHAAGRRAPRRQPRARLRRADEPRRAPRSRCHRRPADRPPGSMSNGPSGSSARSRPPTAAASPSTHSCGSAARTDC